MPFFDRLVIVMVDLKEVDLLKVGEHSGHIFVQLALLALEGQDIVRLLVDDLRGDICLTTHGVNGHNAAG